MKQETKGFVETIGCKEGTTKKGKFWKLYSVKIQGIWYSCGFNNDPGCKEGAYVSFNWEIDDRDNKAIDMGSFEIQVPTQGVTTGLGDAASTPTTTDSKDLYWARKDVQARIGYARAAAIDIIQVAVTSDIIPLGTKATKASDKFDLLLDIVDMTTMHFFDMSEESTNTIMNGTEEKDEVGSDDFVDYNDDIPF